MSNSQMSTLFTEAPERAPVAYTPPKLVVIGQWRAVTLLVSGHLGDVSVTGLLSEPLQYFGRDH